MEENKDHQSLKETQNTGNEQQGQQEPQDSQHDHGKGHSGL